SDLGHTGSGGTLTDTDTVAITVTAVDDPSVLTNDTNTTNEDNNATGNVLTNDSDVDNTLSVASFVVSGDSTTYTAGQTATITGKGTMTIASDGSYTFTPVSNWNGTVPTITYTTNTGSTATLIITITAVNDAPTSTDDSVTTAEDTAVVLSATDFGSYTDIEGTDLNKIKITSLPAAGTLQYNSSGSTWDSVTLNQEITAADIVAGKLRFTPAANANGSPYTTLQFKVSDGTDYSTSAYTLTVNVTAVNDAPVNTVPSSQTTNEDTSLVFSSGNSNQIQISDVDDGGSTMQVALSVSHGTLTLVGVTGLSFSVGSNGSASMTFTGTKSAINTALATLTYAPTANYNGSDTLTITTSDLGHTGSGGTLTDTDTVAITVTAVDD
ncbi:MAG: tandem-95 repeat protein, partial [Actinobacteria bacterium]|nr:tandem-95 repeat protein [Actinomycetota bacterium]